MNQFGNRYPRAGKVLRLLPVSCLVLFFAVMLSGCPEAGETRYNDLGARSSQYNWALPERIPLPVEPAGNPMTEAKFQLGRHLFYDERLSGNGTMSCASCHKQERAFSEDKTVSVGSTGELLARNAQALVNVGYNATQTWANPSLLSLEAQVQIPLFGEIPIEHGITESNKEDVLQDLRDEPRYDKLFAKAFPGQRERVNFHNVTRALTSFVRGLTSFNAPFDRFQEGDSSALSSSAKRGMQLFFSEQLECFHCHGGYNFTDSVFDRTMLFSLKPFHNTGLYNIDGSGSYPPDNIGIMDVTGNPDHMGKFRAQTLRNIELTSPYMHDGSIATLEQVIRTYAAGGRNLESGPYAGDGRSNPFKSGFVSGFSITDQQVDDLIAFLHSLTDSSFVSNPRFFNPWIETTQE